MKKILFLLIGLFIFPLSTYAVNVCDNTSSFSSNVNIAYIVDSTNVQPVFKIYITNLTSDMFVVDKVTSKIYKNFSVDGSSIEVDTVNSGNYNFEIYSTTCKKKLRTISVTLPTYNKYYNDERCKGYQNYSICKRWSGYNKDDSTFEKELNQIKESIKQQQEKDKQNEEKKENNDLFHKILKIAIKYWIQILIGIVLIIMLLIVKHKNKKKKEFDFKL